MISPSLRSVRPSHILDMSCAVFVFSSLRVAQRHGQRQRPDIYGDDGGPNTGRHARAGLPNPAALWHPRWPDCFRYRIPLAADAYEQLHNLLGDITGDGLYLLAVLPDLPAGVDA